MEENLYAPPESMVSLEVQQEIPPAVLKKIKEASTAGFISGAITTLFILFSMYVNPVLNMKASSFIDVALIVGLAFGIMKRSRVCAILLFIYFVFAKIYMIIISPTLGTSGLIMGAIFAYYFFQGIVGTYQYHKIISQKILPTQTA